MIGEVFLLHARIESRSHGPSCDITRVYTRHETAHSVDAKRDIVQEVLRQYYDGDIPDENRFKWNQKTDDKTLDLIIEAHYINLWVDVKPVYIEGV